MVTVGAHYQHAQPKALYPLQQDVGGFPIGLDVVQLVRSPVSFQEIARKLSERSSVPVTPVHTQHVNRLASSQAEKLEGLQGMRHFSSASVRHNDAVAGR